MIDPVDRAAAEALHRASEQLRQLLASLEVFREISERLRPPTPHDLPLCTCKAHNCRAHGYNGEMLVTIAGPARSGKTVLAKKLSEVLADMGYEVRLPEVHRGTGQRTTYVTAMTTLDVLVVRRRPDGGDE